MKFSLNLTVSTRLNEAHWFEKNKANRHNSRILRLFWLTLTEKPKAPCHIILERVYKSPSKEWDEDDNLRYAFKGVKDIIADLIVPNLAPGQADGKKHGLTWEYRQVKGEKNSINIEIRKYNDT